MKRFWRWFRVAAGAGFPRRNRRGLIEALRMRSAAAIATVGFPGGIAGASLKPFLLTLRGKIRVPGFPGGIAGASLKPRYAQTTLEDVRRVSPAESPGPH